MPRDLTLRVCALYPEVLNIYADRGNLLFLRRRCEWRGIGFQLLELSRNVGLDPDACDLIYIGGGQDRDQELCAADMIATKRQGLSDAMAQGRSVLAVCGGYQLLGRSYGLSDRTVPGTAVAPLTTTAGGDRLIGPAAIQTGLGGPAGGILVGFENHAGRTELDHPGDALGTVLAGNGNNGADCTEGFRKGSVVGTYLHGPLLPKNWWFADWLIAQALGLGADELAPLDDQLECAAHREACIAAGVRPAC